MQDEYWAASRPTEHMFYSNYTTFLAKCDMNLVDIFRYARNFNVGRGLMAYQLMNCMTSHLTNGQRGCIINAC